MHIDLPKGIRAFNTDESFQIKYLEDKISKIFQLWGYERLLLPTIEYFDVHKKGIGKDLANKTFRLIDRAEGEIITLRADFTSQIARYIASLQKKEFPIRYYYSGNIFRYLPPKGTNLWERRQIGIELIGVSELEADAEIIAIASNTLKKLNVENFQIDINNTNIFDNLKNILELSEEEYSQFMGFIKNKEIYYLKEFCKNKKIEESLKEFVIGIPKFQGGIDTVVKLKEKLKNYEDLVKSFDELIKINSILEEYDLHGNIIFDIGEPKEFSYYTGIVFEIFIKGFNMVIGHGGRYNNLLSKYNGDYPATGFAFDLFYLWEYITRNNLIKEKNEKDFFIIDTTHNKKAAYQLAKYLREKGFSVARDIIKREVKDSLQFAFKNNYKKAVVIGLDSLEENIYIYTNLNEYEKKNIKEFMNSL